MLKVVPSAVLAFELKARTVSSPTRGAVPSMVRRAAIAPAMPVPCECGFSSSVAASKRGGDGAGEIGMRGIDLRNR